MTGTERKVFQKYYPPDFDPNKLTKAKGKKGSSQFVQRVMAPFNMQCNTCSEYIYKGKKFNMRRETAQGEDYLGLKIFRFYFRCPNCLAELVFKTDIENVDYQMEHGATRLFEAAKYYQQKQKEADEQEEAEKNDPMKVLEKRTQASRAEMEAINKLEELQEMNRRNNKLDPLSFLDAQTMDVNLTQAQRHKLQEEEDEKEIQRLLAKKNVEVTETVEEVIEEEEKPKPGISALKTQWKPGPKKPASTLLAGFIKKKPRIEENPPHATSSAMNGNSVAHLVPSNSKSAMCTVPSSSGAAALGALVGDYGSSSDDD